MSISHPWLCLASLLTASPIALASDHLMLFRADAPPLEVARDASRPSDPGIPSMRPALVADLNVTLEITDMYTGTPVTDLYPGQEIFLMIHFDELLSLGVPPSKLVGQTITATYEFSGVLSYESSWDMPTDVVNLSGMGTYYTVPEDARPGVFDFYGEIEISNVRVKDNSATESYRI